MKGNKILFLGNGPSVKSLVDIASEEDYTIVVIGLEQESEVAKCANVFYNGTYLDKELCLSIARKEDVNGVLGTTELAMPTAAYIASEMHLPGNDYDGVNTIIHKYKFRELQQKLDLFSLQCISESEEKPFIDKVKTLPFPIVVKPDQSSSSRGVKTMFKYEETALLEAFRAAKSFSSDGIVCAEKYIPAPGNNSFLEFSVFMVDGKIEYFFPFNDVRTKYNSSVPAQCSLPVVLTEERIEIAKRSIDKLLKATNTKFGEYDVEAFFTSEGQFFIIEINPRRGGGDIQLYIKEHSGVDLSRLILQMAVDDRRYYEELKGRKMLRNYVTKQCLFSGKSGRFKNLEIHPEIKKFVRKVDLYVKEGDSVNACIDYRDKIGEAVLVFETREQQLEYYDRIEDYLIVELF